VTPALALLLAVLLIAGNGFFVGVEFALLAARQTKLTGLAQGSRRAKLALRARRELPLMISGCQFGITICSLGLGAVAEPALSHLIEPAFEAAGLPHGALHPVGFVLALLVTAALHMVLGEMVPKNIALAGPERAAVLLAPTLLLFIQLFRPVIVGLTAVSAGVLRLLGVEPVGEGGSAYTAEQVAELVDEARREGLLRRREHDQVVGALQFQQPTAVDVLLPTSELVTVTPEATAAEVEDLVAATGFSRFPVVADAQLVGYLHLTDVLRVPAKQRGLPLGPGLVRSLPKVPSSEPLHEVLTRLQGSGAHLAEVFGTDGSLGVVALEDVLEQLVGEIRDAT
jgi:CBS domain containing-hemolysin-like protein